ncbi:PREDICTED: uncharacterized protein LOC107162643 isoform X2 [Diuraphis noxia]|nr:PREDICTED: uncharacterized protein LOC107162643 isoform X2 [Diuraphis noxia]
MLNNTFNQLLTFIEPKMKKGDTRFRKSIPPNERLALTLRYLTTGDSFASLALLFRISKASISSIITEVCTAIIEELQDYVQMPKTQDEWLSVAKTCEEIWNFPHYLGAIDGKHIQLQAPIGSGSEYFNYKGCQSRILDSGVFRNTSFFKLLLDENKLELPPAMILNGREIAMTYVFVADKAFPLKENILKPYPGTHEKGSIKRTFNYRLSRVRRVVENAFGVLSAVFRKPMLYEPEKATIVELACIYLHNFLRRDKASKDMYSPSDSFDREIDGRIIDGSWRHEVNSNILRPIQKIARKFPRVAEDLEQSFQNIFPIMVQYHGNRK